MNDDLARLMFEAAEAERTVRGDFTTTDALKNSGGRSRRWTELPIAEQDCWEAAARVARKQMVQNICGDLRHVAEFSDDMASQAAVRRFAHAAADRTPAVLCDLHRDDPRRGPARTTWQGRRHGRRVREVLDHGDQAEGQAQARCGLLAALAEGGVKRRRRKRHGGCRGKARYGSYADAISEQPAQHAYPCVHCGCWHLTSNELPRGAR